MSHPDPTKEYDEVESHKVWQEAIKDNYQSNHPSVLEQLNYHLDELLIAKANSITCGTTGEAITWGDMIQHHRENIIKLFRTL